MFQTSIFVILTLVDEIGDGESVVVDISAASSFMAGRLWVRRVI